MGARPGADAAVAHAAAQRPLWGGGADGNSCSRVACVRGALSALQPRPQRGKGTNSNEDSFWATLLLRRQRQGCLASGGCVAAGEADRGTNNESTVWPNSTVPATGRTMACASGHLHGGRLQVQAVVRADRMNKIESGPPSGARQPIHARHQFGIVSTGRWGCGLMYDIRPSVQCRKPTIGRCQFLARLYNSFAHRRCSP